mmetsp:Transcript_63140/g.117450  ORF Transcript_63140/g.117450 Transcript_63140/m.117450 type:complete len:213 (-) Transcript_63140:163-801(-)
MRTDSSLALLPLKDNPRWQCIVDLMSATCWCGGLDGLLPLCGFGCLPLFFAKFPPLLGNLGVEVRHLKDTHQQTTHADPLEQVQEDAMPRVWKPTTRVPHLPIRIANLPDIDEEHCKRHGHVEDGGQKNEPRRTPLLPVGALPVVTLEVGVLENVGEQDAGDKRLQGVEEVVQCLWNFMPGNIQKCAKENGPTSGADKAGHRDDEAAQGATG